MLCRRGTDEFVVFANYYCNATAPVLQRILQRKGATFFSDIIILQCNVMCIVQSRRLL